jgi:hypothetical protein
MEKVVIKFEADAKDLQNMKKELQETGKVSEQTVQKFIEIQKVTTKADESFKSFSSRVKEARIEAQKLSDQFGSNSSQAIHAAENVGRLEKQLKDFNTRVQVVNPNAKFLALNQALTGSIAAFQGVTGAIQLFGGSSEKAKIVAEKLQGALNLSMGIANVFQLVDAMKNLRLVLVGTTAAQEALTAAEVEGTVAAKGFTAALSSNAIGLILVGLGAIATYFLLIKDNADEATVSIEGVIENQLQRLTELKKKQEDALALSKEQGASDVELLKTRLANLEVEEQILQRIFKRAAATQEGYKIQLAIQQLGRDELLLKEQLTNAIEKATLAELQRAQAVVDAANASRQALKAQFEAEFQSQNAVIDAGLQMQLKVNQLNFDDKYTKRQADLVSEIDALEKKKEKAKEFAKDTSEIDLEIALKRKELRNVDLEEAKAKQQAELDLLSNYLSAYGSIAASIGDMSKSGTEDRINQLEDEKNRGIITEKQYAEKVRILKRKQAQEDKELALFQAAINIAQAILAANKIGAPQNIAAMALASAVGAFQLAAIASRPIPKFNKGRLPQFAGQYTGDDNQLAWVASEEAIIPALTTRAYRPTLEAIYKGQISPSEFNNFVKGKTKGNRTDVRATINPYDLSRAMNNRKVKIANSSELAKSIAMELTGNYSARRA